MKVIEQPRFSPEYVPAVIDGETKPNSIQIRCLDEDTNEFEYSAWDGQARWFELVQDGEVVFAGPMEVGDTLPMVNSSEWLVRYFVNEIYEYKVVNGKCDTTEDTTTTSSPPPSSSTTQPNVPDDTTTSTAPPETSSTTSPTENTSTSVPPEESSDSPTTTEASPTLLVSGPGRPEIMMDCRWDDSMSQFLGADGRIMAYEECSGTSQRDELAYSGYNDLNLGHIGGGLVLLGAILLLAREGWKRHKIDKRLRKNLINSTRSLGSE